MNLIMICLFVQRSVNRNRQTSLLVKEMHIMSDSQFQNTSNQNQFQNNYDHNDGRKALSVDIK